MAGEVTGKVYEAITKVALETAIKGNRRGWSVLWHQQPDWVDIEADLTIGKDADSTEALVMVTHSTSEGYSQKKYWRNSAEFLQWKVQGPQPVRCFAVVFDAAIKEAIKKAEFSVLDGVLEVGARPYGRRLLAYVRARTGDFGASDAAREAHVQQLVTTDRDEFDAVFARMFDLLAADLASLVRSEAKEMGPAWDILRRIHKRKISVPKARCTYVRNGIAKLMVFDDQARPAVYKVLQSGDNLADGEAPQYALDLGLVQEDICGAKVDDTEMLSAVRILGQDTCEAVIARAPARMQDFVDPVRSIGNIAAYSQFVVAHFDELKTGKGMLKWLKACYDDPAGILPKDRKLSIPPRDVWLFVYCMTLEKAEQQKVVAYGLSNLAAETGYPEIGAGGFVVPPFVHRQKLLPTPMLTAISRVFAEKIQRIGRDQLAADDFTRSMKAMLIQRAMYVLSTYRNFDPLTWLVQAKLDAVGLKSAVVTVPTFFKEVAGVASSTSVFIRVTDDAIVYTQMVTDAGRVHKTKELSARFRATKIKWDGKQFARRASANRIYLVVDGEWRDEDLEVLMRSGADNIFYPDEMNQLVAALGGKQAAAKPQVFKLPDEEVLPMAAEEEEPITMKRRGE